MAFPTTSRAFSLFVTLAVALGIFINYLDLSDSDDPFRCKALLHDGSWIDPPDSNGNRDPFRHWQPRGCLMHQYKPKDIQDCMEGRPMYFFGDSTTRQIYYAMARLLDRKKANKERDTSYKNGIHNVEYNNVTLRQAWIPLMEAGVEGTDVQEQLELYRQERLHPVPIHEQKSAAFLFMGVGIWFSARFEEGVSLDKFKAAFENVSDILQPHEVTEFGARPMTFDDGVGSEFFVGPPVPPFFDGMPDSRKTGIATRPGELEAIDDYLMDVEQKTKISVLWSYTAFSRDQPRTIEDLKNGYHVTDRIAEEKANLLLNLRCNAKLDKQQGYPYDRTCCSDYGSKNIVQLVVLGLALLYVGVVSICEVVALSSGQPPRWRFCNRDVSIFVTALLACYWADRTHAFAKGAKAFATLEFLLLSALAILAGAVSCTKSRPPPPKPGSPDAPSVLQDTKPLSRDQTDEWKGWMQAVVLIYHWTGASGILNIYIVVRLLVAAYLFQTGYGHAVFFVTKKDFSFKRVASVMLRLNLLSCTLPYLMNTEYMYYYFAPLVSFWFMVIYATFAVGRKFNDNTYTLFAKLVASAFIFPGLMLQTPVTSWIFAILRAVFRIQWNLPEWQFRLGLDWLVVYVGMALGILSVRTKLYNQILMGTYGLAGVGGIIAMPVYCIVASIKSDQKQDYNKFHPLLSFIPIVSFIASRNMTRHARVWYSRSFAWLGRCSLETFTLQFHILLAADTKGVLLFDVFQGDGSLLGDRWRALFVIVPLFLWISGRVADATGAMVKMLVTDTGSNQRDAEEIDLESKADAEPLMGGSFWTKHMPSKNSWVTGLKMRMAVFIILLWVLNLASVA